MKRLVFFKRILMLCMFVSFINELKFPTPFISVFYGGKRGHLQKRVD